MKWRILSLKKNWQFEKIINFGEKIFDNYFNIFFTKNDLENCRFGICVSKKIVKKSVKRNFYKRQIRNIIINYNKKSKKHFHNDKIIIIRKNFFEKTFFEKNQKLNNLLSIIDNKYKK